MIKYRIVKALRKLSQKIYNLSTRILGDTREDYTAYYAWTRSRTKPGHFSAFRTAGNVILVGEGCNNKGSVIYNKCSNTCTCHK